MPILCATILQTSLAMRPGWAGTLLATMAALSSSGTRTRSEVGEEDEAVVDVDSAAEEQADSASLTLTLQDTLASRYPSWADQFSVELQGNNLEGVTLHLRTQWPLTLVLNQVCLMVLALICIWLAKDTMIKI